MQEGRGDLMEEAAGKTVYPVITYIPAPEELVIRPEEINRYLGYGRETVPETDQTLIDRCREQVKRIMAGKACYSRFPVVCMEDNRIRMPYGVIESRHLSRHIAGCREIYIFAATIGAAFDRFLTRTRLTSMAEAAVLQACGAAAIEAVCDALNDRLAREAAEEGKSLCSRYSPGYGDLALENQRGVFEVLNPSKYIGLSLMDTMIMSPEKSVTAIIGIREKQEGESSSVQA
ncbi:MAG: Vitamin B12 dependent methionine synthase activation subunit [Lachnospiraceae bacterium]|nr:Vitamin B12 dependent methionine synthase activation subunit [Lachnospiraceae bacterium]